MVGTLKIIKTKWKKKRSFHSRKIPGCEEVKANYINEWMRRDIEARERAETVKQKTIKLIAINY